MHNRIVFVSSLIALLILAAMLNFTTPTGVGPFGVLVFFTTLYVVMFGAVTMGYMILRKMWGKKGRMGAKDYLYTAVLAFGPIVLLLMQGFSGLSVVTVGLTALAVGLGCFLVYKKA